MKSRWRQQVHETMIYGDEMITLTEADREDIAARIASKLHECSCGLSPESRSEMGHLIGCFRDIGNGNLSAGIERSRDAFRFILAVQNAGAKIGGKIALALLTGAALVASGFVWVAVWQAIKGAVRQ